MAEEPQPDPTPPSTTPSAPAADVEDPQPSQPASAEDRKTLAALSSLSTTDSQSEDVAFSGQRSLADQKALGEAMNRLEIAGGGTGAKKAKEAGAGSDGAIGKGQKEGEEERKKRIKVDAADVSLLVGDFLSSFLISFLENVLFGRSCFRK